MGYILPVQNNQYADYQNRVVQEKKDRMFIESPFKAFLETKYDEANQTDTREFELLKEETEYIQKHEQDNVTKNPYGKERVIAEITGKGNLFNDKI